MDIISYSLSKKIAASAVSGVQSMSVSGQTLTINTKDSGVLTMTFPTPKDGVSVTDIDVNANNQIVFTMSDGSEFISGKIPTVKGDPFKYSDFTQEQLDSLKGSDGVSPTITENADNTDKIYKLDITTADSTFTTPNLKGADGTGGTGSGEENVIESIKVNGVVQTVADDKSVDITIPTVDVDKNYVDTELAKKANTSDIPSLDGYAKTSEIPSKVSELENDSNYLSSIPEEYVTETELEAKGYLTEHQDISGKVDKVEGKSLISDTEIARLASVDNYDDTAIKAEIAKKADANTIPSKVSELTNDSNYQTAEQVSSTVTTEIAKVVADAPESLNTLKEMSDWIAGHEDDASAMNSAISDNKTAITALQTGKADKNEIPTTVAELTDSGDYAKKTDLHSHDNKTVLDGITSTKVSDWDSAKTHADSAHAPSNAQANVLESVKVNNQEITPDDNKAVNIDLTNYAEHDEIVGENLIPYPYADGMSKTMNGIEYTVNPDGSVTAVGTAIETSAFVLAKYLSIDPNATYILSGDLDDEITYKSSSILFNAETSSGTSYWNYGKDKPVIFTGISVMANFRIRISKDETVNQTFYPMLEIGNIPHKYQQYKLSRNNLREDIDELKKLDDKLENQFNIASGDYITLTDSVDGNIVELGVKGNSYQKQLQGYNLIPFPYYSESGKSSSGLTFTYGDDFNITVNGTISSSYAGFAIARNIKVDAVNKKYMLIGLPTTGSGTTHKLRVRYVFPDGTMSDFTNCYNVNGDILDKKDSTYEGATMEIDLMCYDDKDNFQVRPMLVEVAEDGSYPTEYEPYVGGSPSPSPSYPQAINSVGDDGSLVVTSCGKNLIPYPYLNSNKIYNGITYTVNTDGSVTANGTATGTSSFSFINRSNENDFLTRLKKGTYTLTGCPHGVSGCYIQFAYGTPSAFGEAIAVEYGNGVTFDYDDSGLEDYNGQIIIGIQNGTTVNNVVFKPMLVDADMYPNTTYDDYESCKTSTTTIPLSEPLRAIGDVKDEITYQDGKWGVLRRTGKHVIDGTESWVLDSDHIVDCGISARLGSYANILKGISSVTGNTKDMITDYLRCIEYETIPYYATSNSVQEDKGSGTYRTPGNIWISFGASDIEKMGITKDIDSVKAWLSSHNITFIYPLGTPTFTPFTDQTLPYLSTYDGVTNISNDDALSAEMTVKYPTTDVGGVGSRNESRIAEIEGTVGNTDISAIGDGTVTGAISSMNSNFDYSFGTVTMDSNITSYVSYEKYGKFVHIKGLFVVNTAIAKDGIIITLPFESLTGHGIFLREKAGSGKQCAFTNTTINVVDTELSVGTYDIDTWYIAK